MKSSNDAERQLASFIAKYTPEVGALACRILGYISSEKVYKSACGTQRHVEEPEKRGFASAGSSG